MNEALPGKTIDEVQVWPSGNANLYLFVPGAPRLDRLQNGQPAITLINAGPITILQVTWRWDLDEDDKVRLASAIVRTEPGLDPASLQLAPASVEINETILELASADGGWVRIAGGRPSGPPAFVTAMSASLDEAKRRTVDEALAGTRDRLRARMLGHLAVPHWAEARITGDGAGLLADLPADADQAAALAAVDLGIEKGVLTRTASSSPGAPEELTAEADREARTRAVKLLLALRLDDGAQPKAEGWPECPGAVARTGNIDATTRLTRSVRVQLERIGDAAGTDRT